MGGREADALTERCGKAAMGHIVASPRHFRNLQFGALQHDTGERLAASAVMANQASDKQISACRQDNLAKVFAGIDQLVSAASIGERKGPCRQLA
jgi:hypothetical protein